MSSRIELLYGSAKEFAAIVDAIAAFLDEANLVLTPEGVKLRALDASRSMMIVLDMPREGFDEYPDLQDEIRIGLNFADLKKQFKRIKKEDRLRIVVDLDRNLVMFAFEGRSKRSFVMPLMAVEQLENIPDRPKMEEKVIAKLMSDAFKELMKDIDAVAEAVRIIAEEDRLIFRDSAGKYEAEITRSDQALFEYEVHEPSRASYSMDYMADIAQKASKISDTVELAFATDKPIRITVPIVMGGSLTFYVAPMIG